MKSYSLKMSNFFLSMDHLCHLTRVLHGLDIPYRFTKLEESHRGGRHRTAKQELIFFCDDSDNLASLKKYMEATVMDVYVTKPRRKLFGGGTKEVRTYPASEFRYTIVEIIP